MKKIFFIIIFALISPLFVNAEITAKINGVTYTSNTLAIMINTYCDPSSLSCDVEIIEDADTANVGGTANDDMVINVNLAGHTINTFTESALRTVNISNGVINEFNIGTNSSYNTNITMNNITFGQLNIQNAGTITLNNSQNNPTGEAPSLKRCIIVASRLESFNINGGTYTGCIIPNVTSLNITSGTFNGIQISNGLVSTLKISGGTFKSSAAYDHFIIEKQSQNGEVNTEITGGSFSCDSEAPNCGFIYGGKNVLNSDSIDVNVGGPLFIFDSTTINGGTYRTTTTNFPFTSMTLRLNGGKIIAPNATQFDYNSGTTATTSVIVGKSSDNPTNTTPELHLNSVDTASYDFGRVNWYSGTIYVKNNYSSMSPTIPSGYSKKFEQLSDGSYKVSLTQEGTNSEEPIYIPGDWNGNGLEIQDIIAYRKYLAGDEVVINDYGKLAPAKKESLDLNSDGDINLVDLIIARIREAN